jgi:hypothetical protein
MDYKLFARDSDERGVTFIVDPTVNYLVINAIERECAKLGIKVRTLHAPCLPPRENSTRVLFETPQTEETRKALIEALTGGDPTKDVPLEEAGRLLMKALDDYCGGRYAMVGLDEVGNQLYLYAQTRKRGNELAAFVGWTFHGYKIVVKAVGKIRLLAR